MKYEEVKARRADIFIVKEVKYELQNPEGVTF